MVRIKSREQIEATLNQDRRNRGLGFDEEMARFCGRTARVQARVTKCMDEKTGRMLTMKNPCIVLEGIVCAGVYKASCPRQVTCVLARDLARACLKDTDLAPGDSSSAPMIGRNDDVVMRPITVEVRDVELPFCSGARRACDE